MFGSGFIEMFTLGDGDVRVRVHLVHGSDMQKEIDTRLEKTHKSVEELRDDVSELKVMVRLIGDLLV